MGRKSPAFSFYPDSWFLGTMNLSLEQQGILIRLLCYQWSHGPSMLQAYVQACAQASSKHVLEVLELKFKQSGDLFWNERLEEERLKQESRTTKAKSAAKSRWDDSKHAPSIAPSMRQASPQAYAPAMHSDSVSVSSTNTDTVSDSKASARPASVDEVRQYCLERGNSLDPQQWWDHYQSNGWMVGRSKMKDWRAAVRTWEKNGINKSTGQEKKRAYKPGIDPPWNPNG